jgi:hypothetical protein
MLKQQYEIHPVADLFPLMSEAEYQGLKDDINENGQREDIVVWKGQLIDGRNRLRACNELGRNPSIAELDDELDPLKYVISHNLHRRHLTTSQRSMVAAGIANLQKGDNQHKKEGTSIDVPSIESAAKQLNVGKASVERARAVKDKGAPGLADMVRDGKVSVDAASKVAKKPKAEQAKIVADGPKAVKKAASAVPKIVKPGEGTDSPQALAAPIQAVATQLNGMLKELKRLADHTGGEWLDLTDLETQINLLKHSIRQSVYWMDCMDCGGKGCKTCRKLGWLSLDRKKYLTQEQKDKVGL